MGAQGWLRRPLTARPLLPGPGLLMGPVVFAHDDFPDPLIRKLQLPAWHRRFPGHALDRQPHPTLLDPPVQVGLLELGDRRPLGFEVLGRAGVSLADVPNLGAYR